MVYVSSLSIGGKEIFFLSFFLSAILCRKVGLNINHVKIRDNHCNLIAAGKIYRQCKIILEMCYVLEKANQLSKLDLSR